MSSDLQDIVRRVVENLSNIQPANSAATSSSEGCQNFINETEVQELNRCFRVPRLPAPNSSVLQQSSGRDLAAGFSSRQNYSSARQPRMRRQVPRSSSGRFQPYARNCSRGGNRDVVEPPSYFKDVCVLPNPSWERVPRGKMKVFCINKNMYVDAWEVKKDWDESESDCEEEPGAQTTQQGTDIRQFSSTTSTTAGAIDGTTGGAGGGAAGAIDGLTSASTQARLEFLTAQLQSMFPQTSTSAITQAISNAQNLQGAIDCLLAANRRDIRDHDHQIDAVNTTSSAVPGTQVSETSICPLTVAESYPLKGAIPFKMCHLDPYDAIKLHKSRVLSLGTQEILINRQCGIMLRDLFKKFKRGDLDIKKVPDVTFIGEEGIDAEGLSKEFFTLVMNALTSGTGGYIMFEGGSDHLVPVISEEYYQSGYFRFVGQLIAMSVLNSGIGIVGLSRALTTYMVTEDVELASCNLSIDDVPDYCVQQALMEVHVLLDK
ncbi:unnamed protein product [Porites lobata]|uniref:Uncharacterized protein n=1 Tax=Porites lobata TaxID=104759 RepID=A0ABN8P645_9CNID|nr:unnamed protein product [Porites lobata]